MLSFFLSGCAPGSLMIKSVAISVPTAKKGTTAKNRRFIPTISEKTDGSVKELSERTSIIGEIIG